MKKRILKPENLDKFRKYAMHRNCLKQIKGGEWVWTGEEWVWVETK